MGENIADLGGLVIALDAYHLALRAARSMIDGYTGEQRLFLAYAQSSKGKASRRSLGDQLVSESHSPRRFRVDGVVLNTDAWYLAFDLSPETSSIFLQTRGLRLGSRPR